MTEKDKSDKEDEIEQAGKVIKESVHSDSYPVHLAASRPQLSCNFVYTQFYKIAEDHGVAR